MSDSHFGGNIIPEITREEHDGVNNAKRVSVVSGLFLSPFDYVSMAISPTTTETYTFKSGGASGTTTNTVVIVYTDATRADISTVTKT